MEERKDNENDQLIPSSVWPLGAPDKKKKYFQVLEVYIREWRRTRREGC